MPIHSRRYFQMVERKSSDVNPLWKVFHALTFIVIVMMSLTAAYSFHSIFDSFSYNCVLYAKPVVHLTNITYQPEPINDSNITDTVSNNTSEVKRQVDTRSNASDVVTTSFDITTTAPDIATIVDAANTTTSDEEATVTKRSSLQIINNEYWIRNATLDAKLEVNLRETIFGSNDVCNTVLFYPLFALVLATFAAVIVMICGKGGRGYRTELFPQQWIYLYPFLLLSFIMVIFNAVVLGYLHIGMERFCSELNEYTGLSECSTKINYFTNKNGFGDSNLYEKYHRCLVSLFIELILWLVQMLLIIMRITCMADFQLSVVKVSCRRRRSLEYDDPVNKVLLESFQGIRRINLVGVHQYDIETRPSSAQTEIKLRDPNKEATKKKVTFLDDQKASTSRVHEALTKNHALKKVTFEEKKSPKDDEEKPPCCC